MSDVTLSGLADGLSLYNALRDEYPKSLGPRNWLGNLRWIAVEQSDLLSFVFRTCPTDESEAEFSHAGNTLACARRTLFGLKIEGVEGIAKFAYRADGVEVGSASADLSLVLPLNDYGAVLSVVRKNDRSPLGFGVKTSAAAGRLPVHETQIQIESKPGLVVMTDGAYTIAFRHDGEYCALAEGGFEIRNLPAREVRLTVAFHVIRDIATGEANRLFERADDALLASRKAWQVYLASCPLVRFDKDYTYYNAFLGRQITFTAGEIFERQLWHWYCVLMNVYHIDFNRLSASIYPEKNGWMGVWSNDSPESMRALAHTGRRDLARDCIQQYIRFAINDEGDHSWYTHGTGIGCIGNPGDSGRLSHGVPAIVNAVAEYVRESGDVAFLDAPVGEKWTVWTKLKHYMETVFQRRDINGDGLVEWTHLWEGGGGRQGWPVLQQRWAARMDRCGAWHDGR